MTWGAPKKFLSKVPWQGVQSSGTLSLPEIQRLVSRKSSRKGIPERHLPGILWYNKLVTYVQKFNDRQPCTHAASEDMILGFLAKLGLGFRVVCGQQTTFR